MGMRHTNVCTSRYAVRALDAALNAAFLGSIEGINPSVKTEGQRLPRRLGSPV
ncbi:MAG: hypothetical protein ACJ72L_03280 [Marmoricola sp.]